MINNYRLEEIQNRLKNEITTTTAMLEAWQKVTFTTKKDGTPYKVISKNIQGATYKDIEYSYEPGQKCLVVHFIGGNGYDHDEIGAYQSINYLELMKDEKKLSKTQNIQPQVEKFLSPVYTYDLDDIKEAVNNRIDYLTGRLESLQKELENSEKTYTETKKAYDALMKILENESRQDGDTTLKDMLKNMVRENRL